MPGTNANSGLNEALIDINNSELPPLEEYARQFIVENRPLNPSKHEIVGRMFLVLLGAAWGVPWRAAAASSAVIFPSEVSQRIFAQIFSGGIVLTVGGDGAWIMLEIGKEFGKKSADEKKLTAQNHSKCLKFSRVAFPALFSFFSCISAVYATIKYNTGAQRFLGIITFLVNYGYGAYGYLMFVDGIAAAKLEKEADKNLVALRNQLIQNIQYVARTPEQQHSIFQAENIIKNLLSINIKEDRNTRTYKYCKIGFQTIFTSLLTVSASAVSLSLTKEFLQNSIYDNTVFAYIIAGLSELPGFIIGSKSNCDTLGRIFDLFSQRGSSDTAEFLAKQLYPRIRTYAPLLILIASLTAPSAAALITYQTLGKDGIGSTLQWLGTIAMIAARVTFSNYTLTKIMEGSLLNLHEFWQPATNESRAIRLERFSSIVSRTNLRFFKPFLSNNVPIVIHQQQHLPEQAAEQKQSAPNHPIQDKNNSYARKSWCVIM